MERQKILIVEDDADISALLVKIMEGEQDIRCSRHFPEQRHYFVWNRTGKNYRTVCC